MSGNPKTIMIPVEVELPFDAEAAGEVISELQKTVAELKGLIETCGARLCWTEKELAAEIGVTERTLWEDRRAGKLKYKRIGGKIYYSRKHIEDYLNSGN